MVEVMAAPAPYRFTRADYYRMGEAGIFDGKRVELLDGTVVVMSPQSSPHAASVYRVFRALQPTLGSTACIRSQLPIVLDDWSEPEPDIAVCKPDPLDYARAHPTAAQVFLVIEVAASSLGYDRLEKANAYARSGIGAYWIVNLEERTVEVLTDPDLQAGRYLGRSLKHERESLALPGGAGVPVADLLPPI